MLPEETFVPPEQIVTDHIKKQKERQEQYNKDNRLKEGEYEGRILKLVDGLSKNKNPMWVMTLRCTGNLGKPVDELKRFCKHLDFQMAEFYKIIEMLGYDLKKIRKVEDIGNIVDQIVEDLPKVKFVCKHQKEPSTYNEYEIKEAEKIAKGPYALGGTVATTTPSAELTSEEPKAPVAIEYTAEDVKDFDKSECIEVAAEIGCPLKGKTKSKMQAELVAFLNPKAEKKAEEPKVEAVPEVKVEVEKTETPVEVKTAESVVEDESPFPDID